MTSEDTEYSVSVFNSVHCQGVLKVQIMLRHHMVAIRSIVVYEL